MEKRKWTQDEVSEYRKEKGQLFYYNRQDSNIFVRREIGLGFSPNWASPWSYIIFLCSMVFGVLLFFITKII